MARLGPQKLGLALVFLIFALTLVHSQDKCRSGCHGVTPNHFKYAEGQTYKYNLDSIVDISISNAEAQQSKTQLKATVLLTQQANCNQVIRLQNVQIVGADGKKNTIPDVEKSIRINFHDGHVEDVICTEAGDTQNSLNIKRAVASLFQATLRNNGYETDVFGLCPTDISTHKSGNIQTITKTRNLNRCAHREHVTNDFITTAFNLDSEIKSSPILKSDYTSEMKVKDGILDTVIVTENYLFMPFAIGKNGAKTSVQTKLHFAGKNKDAPKGKFTDSKSLIFENPHPTISKKSDVNTIIQAVKDTADTITETVGHKTAKSFSSLIKIIGVAKKDDLLSAYNQIRSGAGFANKVTAKKVFLDALFRAGTGEAVEVSIELLKNKELSTIEQKMVFLGMAFVKHATLDSLTSAAALLDHPTLPREAYLSIGALAARYCSAHNCHKIDQLNKLTQKFLSKMGDGKATNKEAESNVIAILKGIANMKYLSDAAVPKIIAIAQDKKASNRLRVAALEAYLADPCKDKLRDSAISILKDIQQDSEIRIKAYLALAQCPNGKVANAVKNLMESEPSYQVGVFIKTHIASLRASTNPDKELAKRELGNLIITKKYPLDFTKYSFSTENSYAIDTLGLSSSVEQNIIYSQNSFLPRSACLNLTTEVFGQKVNFLEIDMRQENLDKLMEHYLGPLGVLRSKNPEELLDAGKESLDDIATHILEKFKNSRLKREVPKAEIDNMGKQVQIKTNELNMDLDIDLSMKIFGSEMLYLSLNQDASKYTPKVIIDSIFDVLNKGVDKAKNFDHVFNANELLLDAELTYPTAMGFPLRLAVEGTSAVQIKAAGNIDIAAILNDRDTLLKLTLIPSANIEIAGSMTLDANVVESGIKVVSHLHTATGGHIEVKTKDKDNVEGIDITFSMPLKNQKIIYGGNDIVMITREAGTPEVITKMKFGESKDFMMCLDQLSDVIGQSLCVELDTPKIDISKGGLPFPLNGRTAFGIQLQKEEDVVYHLEHVLYKNKPDGIQKTGAQLLIQTIGADKKPKLSLEVEAFASPEKYIKATLDSSIKKAILEGRITDNDKEKSILGKFGYDDQEYYGKIGVAITGNEAKSTYKPLIEYKVPGVNGAQTPPYTVEGQIIAEKNGHNFKYTLDNVKFIVPEQKPITISGDLGREAEKYFTDIKVDDGTNNGKFKASLLLGQTTYAWDAEFMNTFNPEMNFKEKLQYKIEADTQTLDAEITVGADINSKENTLKIFRSVTNKRKDKDYHYAIKNRISYPAYEVEMKLDCDAKPKKVSYDVGVKYGKVKLASSLDLKYDEKATGDHDFKFLVEGLDTLIKFKGNREINGETSKIDYKLNVNEMKYEVDGTVKVKSFSDTDTDLTADLNVKIHQIAEPIKIIASMNDNDKSEKEKLKISTPSTTFLDYEWDESEKGMIAHAKVNLKDVIIVDAEIKGPKWKGKSHLLVEIPKLKRKLKGETVFDFQAPTKNIEVTFYPNYEKEPTKFVINTKNQIKDGSIESQNIMEAFDQKLEINFKKLTEGVDPIWDGKFIIDTDMTLPNGQYFVFKINREVHTVNGISNGEALLSYERRDNKNTPGHKASMNAIAKDWNAEARTFDITHHVSFDDSNGKNYNADFHVIRKKDGGTRDLTLEGKLFGSLLSSPINFNGQTKYNDKLFDLKWSSKCDHHSSNIEAKFNNVNDKEATFGYLVDIKTSSANIKAIKSSFDIMAKGEGLPNKILSDTEIKMNGALFIDDDGSTPDATVDISGNLDIQETPTGGHLKSVLNIQKMDPITLAIGYGYDDKDIQKFQSDLSLQYAKNKNIKGDLSIMKLDKHEYKMDLKLQTPAEQAKNIQVEFRRKRSEDKNHQNIDMTFSLNDKKYIVKNEVDLTETTPFFLIEITRPDGKVDMFRSKSNKVNPKHVMSEVKLVYTPADFVYDATYDVNFENLDNIEVIAKVDSPKLGLHKFVFEANNKNNKAAKTIEIEATNNGKNVLKGSLTYKSKEEAGKIIIEGSGEFMVKDQKKSGTMKYIRQNLIMDKNGEQGLEVIFDASLGNKALDAEFKFTNRHFRVLESYCEEKKQCVHFEIDSKTSNFDAMEYNHELEVNIDLRKMMAELGLVGMEHEFGLKSITSRKGVIFDHKMDVHLQNQESKYQYTEYLNNKEIGASLTTPKRIISLEGQVHGDKKKSPIKAELALYLNKKEDPKKKTAISAVLDYKVDEKNGDIKAEIKFTTPGLPKDLTVNYNEKYVINPSSSEFRTEAGLTMDIFSKQNNKIVVTGHLEYKKSDGKYNLATHVDLKSQGLQLEATYDQILFNYDTNTHTYKYSEKLVTSLENKKYVSNIIAELSPNKFVSNIKLINKDILHVDSTFQLQDKSQVVDTNVNIFGIKPITSHLEIKNYNTLKFTVAPKDAPNKQLIVNSAFIPGQIADFRADIQKNELLHASVKLDEANFLKPDYGMNTDNIQKLLMQPIQKELANVMKEGKTVGTEVSTAASERAKHLGEIAKKNVPNMKGVKEYYSVEFQKIRDEINADKNIQVISEMLRNLLGATAKILSEMLEKLADIFVKLNTTVEANIKKFAEAFEKDIIPKIKDISDNVALIITKYLESVADIFFAIVGKISAFLDEHQADLKELATVLSTIGQDVGRFIMLNYERVRELVQTNLDKIYQEIKALPIYDEFKERYGMIMKDFDGTMEPIINLIKDILNTIKEIVPSPEAKKLIDDISNYIESKLRNKQVDDVATIDQIMSGLIKTVKELLLQFNIHDIKSFDPSMLNTDFGYALPKAVPAKFSALNYLFGPGEYRTSEDFTRMSALNPRLWIPPYRLYAYIVQGQHIFTFDGKHVTFPGKCNYLLARDAVNGNFTLAGTYTNGIMTAITLADKQDSITLKKGSQVMLNKDATEFPVRRPTIHAFRLYDSMTVKSQSGIEVICGVDLSACLVSISGFYHGQLRGLLGNGNNEPYDDFILPNGKIVLPESDFANAYKMTASCPVVKTVDHKTPHHAPSCTELFGKDSELKECYPFFDPTNFRTACDHGVAAGVKDTEVSVAAGYIAACRTRFWPLPAPVNLPEKFVKCSNSEKPMSVGDEFEVKLPGKAADIVLVVDQAKRNEPVYKELVIPMIDELNKELSAKGMTDVEYHLITYGGEYQKHPSHVTVGGKMTFKGKPPTIKFTDHTERKPIKLGDEKLDYILNEVVNVTRDFQLAIGADIEAMAYNEVAEYPFRAHAVKAILFVSAGHRGDSIRFPILQRIRGMLLAEDVINLNLITNIEGLEVKDPKIAKSIVGFDEDNLLMLSDGKKATKETATLKVSKELDFKDFPAEYTMENEGNVFLSNNFLKAKPHGKQQFIQVATHKMVERMSRKLKMSCECDYFNDYSAKNTCEIENGKEA